jgi:Methyltransferase domain
MDILDQYVVRLPCAQNVIDLFDGEWSSRMPDSSGLQSKPGTAALFADGRIDWAGKVFGGFADRKILELGPLEGAHSFMLQNAGAESITAIEANSRAFLKCLCIKELFGLNRVSFKLGDFVAYLEQNKRKFDIAIASGVLYHMADPIKVLDLISDAADKIFIWTHYFDENIIFKNKDLVHKFGLLETASYKGFEYRFSSQAYKKALDWAGFCGGPERNSKWLTKDSIVGFLSKAGFKDICEQFDQPDHQNGPAFAICAQR